MPTILVNVDQQDHTSSRGEARGHTLIMDRPEAKGGQNKGPPIPSYGVPESAGVRGSW